MGNGVSELILMTLEALLEPGDEVLVPAPDYPLWTAAVRSPGAPVHYPCRPENGFVPGPRGGRSLWSPRARADRADQPEQPDRRGLPAEIVVEAWSAWRRRRLVLIQRRDLRPHPLRRTRTTSPLATLCHETLCATFGGPLQGVPRVRLPRRVGLSPDGSSTPGTTSRGSSCSRRCASARTCRASGRCRPRSAASRASSI
jgi:hypothetical protein